MSFSVGLCETFSGSFAGRCVGPSTGSSLDDLFASVCAEVITSVVKFAFERIDGDDEVGFHWGLGHGFSTI